MAVTTTAELASQIEDFVASVSVRDELFYEWQTGSADGGPNGDGTYPLTDFTGFTRLLKSPAAMASLSGPGGSSAIGFAQSGTGAVARTVHSKLRELAVSVDDFGAVGDNVADDGPAITSAQNALAALGGGELRFTHGRTYRVATPIVMRGGITYKGTGRTGISGVVSATGARLIAAGTSIFVNTIGVVSECKFEDLSLRSFAGGGHIWDWSLPGVVAKIEIDGCTVVQENADKHIIKGTAAGGVFSIWAHDWEYQYATGNTVEPLHFRSETLNSIIIEKFWSTCTTEATSGVRSIGFENTNPGGVGFNCVVRDGVFELPGGGSVKMLSMAQSGIENCMVFDLTVTPNNPQFEIADGAGPGSNNCWLKGVRSRVGTALKPDCKLDVAAGQGNFVVEECSFSVLDGGNGTPSILLIGGDFVTLQNIAYTRLGASPGLDLHFGTSNPTAKSHTLWNGYAGNWAGYLSFDQDGINRGSIAPSGSLHWGGARNNPNFYVASTGEIRTKEPLYPSDGAGSFQSSTAIIGGAGVPSNAVGADGFVYLRSDGGAGSTIYHKRSGAWVGII